MKFRAGIIGVSGYTGLELIKILLNHPNFEISYLAASSASKTDEIFPLLDGILDMDIEVADPKMASKKCDIVFLALPHEKSMYFTKELLSFKDVKVVDLSADYRLSLELYEKNYTAHIDKDGLKQAVYGLVELNKEKIKTARIVANPGCYPTASLLAIAPFINFIDTKFGVIIDAKSGVSGAGKSLKTTSHFCSVNENINAYNPFKHRHADEIKERIEMLLNSQISLHFIPHLVPITRGMLVSVYINLKQDIDEKEILREFYKNAPFIRVKNEPVAVKNVVGTHFCDIFAQKHENLLFINSAIDNLLKGASSQAIANANLMFGFDESLGLPKIAHGL